MIGFYFSPANRRLGYNDNRVIKIGRTHKVKLPIELCVRGLHASKKPLDALQYANSSILYLVKLSGEIIHGGDKSVATKRTYIASCNIENLLREFARNQALINIEKITPYCNKEEYNLIIDWLQTGNKKTRSAAESAALSACSAALSAARSAGWSARSAAWSARSVAELAARSARSAAELAAMSARLEAWSARSVAELAADIMLIDMIREKTGWDI